MIAVSLLDWRYWYRVLLQEVLAHMLIIGLPISLSLNRLSVTRSG